MSQYYPYLGATVREPFLGLEPVIRWRCADLRRPGRSRSRSDVLGIDRGGQQMRAAHRLVVLVRLAAASVGVRMVVADGATEFAPTTVRRGSCPASPRRLHQITRVVGPNASDYPRGESVCQHSWASTAGPALAGENPVHGRYVQADEVGDAGRVPVAQHSGFDEAAFGAIGAVSADDSCDGPARPGRVRGSGWATAGR